MLDARRFADVVSATEGFTGSEIAAIVPDAMYVAFSEDGRAIRIEDLLAAASTVVPLSRSSAEKIEKLRTWAVGRARSATTPEVSTAPATGMPPARDVDL